MGQCPNEVKVDPPEAFVGVSEPAWKELKELVKKARPESVLEPTWIPYFVYKRYQVLRRKLW